jgi:putative transposase
MSRFRKLSQTIWHCQYHIVWLPKYRFRVLKGSIAEEVVTCIRIFSEQLGCEIIEMNIQVDHVHLLVMVPPKVSVSGLQGQSKGERRSGSLINFASSRKSPIGAITSG